MLERLGWDSYFQEQFKPYMEEGYYVARVCLKEKSVYKLFSEKGEIEAKIAGKIHYQSAETGFPSIGDWVFYKMEGRDAVIHGILNRKSKFSRKRAGKLVKEQVIAANIDVIFLVSSLNAEFNLRRVERYLTMIHEGGAQPVLILSKADLCPDAESIVSNLKTVSKDTPIHLTSSVSGEGVDEIRNYLKDGITISLLGSSGVGKSTLINLLSGNELRKTGSIREKDSRGRHTTTNREIILLPGGGVIIDNPGMREMQLWDVDKGVEETFDDIKELETQCYFSNCRHDTEDGCAIKEAIKEGVISSERVEHYYTLQKEMSAVKLRRKKSPQKQRKKKKK